MRSRHADGCASVRFVNREDGRGEFQNTGIIDDGQYGFVRGTEHGAAGGIAQRHHHRLIRFNQAVRHDWDADAFQRFTWAERQCTRLRYIVQTCSRRSVAGRVVDRDRAGGTSLKDNSDVCAVGSALIHSIAGARREIARQNGSEGEPHSQSGLASSEKGRQCDDPMARKQECFHTRMLQSHAQSRGDALLMYTSRTGQFFQKFCFFSAGL